MIDNRELWLGLTFEVEGGFVNHPADPGKATNMGITQKTLSDWRGEEVGPEDVVQLDKTEATNIYLARYWQAVRGDQLPSGLDVYCADFAVGSGPARAAKILQKLVGAEADSFIGPLTLEAIRKRDPLQLLLDYHAARMEFLLSLKTWDTFGRGWTNRCTRVFAVAKDQVKKRPAMAEAASSSIVKVNTAAAGVSGLSLVALIDQFGPMILGYLKRFAEDPTSIDRLQSGVKYVSASGALPMLATGLAGALISILAVTGFTAMRRMGMFWKGMK
jgi:lysozyme family protein